MTSSELVPLVWRGAPSEAAVYARGSFLSAESPSLQLLQEADEHRGFLAMRPGDSHTLEFIVDGERHISSALPIVTQDGQRWNLLKLDAPE